LKTGESLTIIKDIETETKDRKTERQKDRKTEGKKEGKRIVRMRNGMKMA
jgi:hypothetical protein